MYRAEIGGERATSVCSEWAGEQVRVERVVWERACGEGEGGEREEHARGWRRKIDDTHLHVHMHI